MRTIQLVLIVALTMASFGAVSTASANDVTTFNYVVNHQSNPRNVAILNDMVYEYGTMQKLYTKMNALDAIPEVKVNSYQTHDVIIYGAVTFGRDTLRGN
jgi:hypothetical protein